MSRFPVLNGFDELTISQLNYMIDDVNVKASSLTRASTTTLADDTDFAMPLEANATYLIEYWIRHASITAEKLKTAWNPASVGWTGSRQVTGPGTTSADTSADNDNARWGGHAFTTAIAYGNRNSAANAVWNMEWATVITDGTAGNMTLQWAQSTSGATGVTVLSGSYGRARRLA